MIFGVDDSLSRHSGNLKKKFLVLGKEKTMILMIVLVNHRKSLILDLPKQDSGEEKFFVCE